MSLSFVARWMGYLGVMVLVGAATFQAILRSRIAPHHPEASGELLGRTRAAAFLAALFVVIAQVLKLLGQLQLFLEPGEDITREMFNLVLFESGWGHAWQIQAAVAALTLLLIVAVRSTWALIPFAVAMALVGPLTGHAGEHPWGTQVGLLLHTLHQTGGGVWLGTLALVIGAGYGGTRTMPPTSRHALIARLVHAYSPVALAGAGLAVIAGLVIAFAYVQPISAVWTTGYGRMLLLKVLFLAGTAVVGFYNWRRVRPRLGEPVSSTRLYRSATVELILGGLLLGATAILVALPAPGLE